MAMRIEDVLYQHEKLMTPEELEDFHHERSRDAIEEIPRWLVHKTMDIPTPDEFDRDEFERRKPAFGLTLSEIERLEQHAQNPKLTEGGQASILSILRAEVESGVPAPVPEWYTFSDMRYGPRRLGYRKCDARGCLKTETLLGSAFPQCSSCKLAAYCSKDCQIADWKIRHKVLCKKAKAEKDKTQRVSAFLEGFARQHE
ncbi:f-box protein [Fragilaria crotonensis]|nr:f-box protein [Fragilaria crotonensis]